VEKGGGKYSKELVVSVKGETSLSYKRVIRNTITVKRQKTRFSLPGTRTSQAHTQESKTKKKAQEEKNPSKPRTKRKASHQVNGAQAYGKPGAIVLRYRSRRAHGEKRRKKGDVKAEPKEKNGLSMSQAEGRVRLTERE